MMTHLQAPGVYKEEIFLTPRPPLVPGIPIFLGFTEKGPQDQSQANHPEQLTLWPQFSQTFGQPLTNGYLASAVRGFFYNGGTLCYVLRLSDQISLGDALTEGLERIAALEAIDLVCVPDLIRGNNVGEIHRLQQLVLEHCDQMGDRFAILDALPSMDLTIDQAKQDIQHQLSKLQGNNGALYAPWLQNEQGQWVPPCGHVAGIYTQRDRTIGVHHAPANEVLEDVLDLSIRFGDVDQAALTDDGNSGKGSVNCVRSLPGRGIRIWGARTLSREAQWRYVGVRRLFITVGRWAERHLANVAFEPNNLSLCIRIERELTAYLESLVQQGALQGDSPQSAFYVKCDAETNQPQIRNLGQVITEIGLAPTVPSEFIVVRLVHGVSGVTVESQSDTPP